jgi:hypothetical protein
MVFWSSSKCEIKVSKLQKELNDLRIELLRYETIHPKKKTTTAHSGGKGSRKRKAKRTNRRSRRSRV